MTLKLHSDFTANIFQIKRDIDNWKMAPKTAKGIPILSHNFTNLDPQMAEARTLIFTHPLYLLHSASFAAFMHGDHQTLVNHTLLDGRG